MWIAEIGARDRLSELPDSLIYVILSLLPMRDVVSTTLLSKRWNSLWTTIPCLNLCAPVNDNSKDRTRNFFNRALMFWKGPNIMKFRLHLYDHFEMSLAADVDLWVSFAVLNNVRQLDICLISDADASEWVDLVLDIKEDIYRVPQCLNSCSSITHLSLDGCNLEIHDPPSWNQLKSLKIHGFCLGELLISQILLGCPKLEVFELRLLESNENLSIQSTSLKIVKIEKYLYYPDGGGEPAVLRICCANLETLEITGVLYSKCLFTNVSSLSDVTLGFRGGDYYRTRWNESLGQTLRHVFSTIRHVEKVALSSWCVEVLCGLLKECLPSPLPNVTFLKFIDVDIIELSDMKGLSGIFPNLKILVVEGPSAHFNANECSEFETRLFNSVLLQLKTLVITPYVSWDLSILVVMKLLLKHGSKLEKFVIPEKGQILSNPRRILYEVGQKKVIFSKESDSRQLHCCVCQN